MIPKPRSFTRNSGIVIGAAAVGTASPLLVLVPGFEERLASQAAKWGPRWQRGMAHMPHVMQFGARRLEPGVRMSVSRVEPPLKRAALSVDRQMKWWFNM